MMRIKKGLIVLFTVAMVLIFSACNKDENANIGSNLKSIEDVIIGAETSLSDGVLSPESVLTNGDDVYISNVGAKSVDDFYLQKDGDGFIQKIVGGVSTKLTEGVVLDGPKGSVIIGDTLYCNDINRIVGIDLATGLIVKEIDLLGRIPGCRFVNDMKKMSNTTVLITVTDIGVVASVDLETEVIEIISNVEGVNGVEIVGGAVYLNQYVSAVDGTPIGKVGYLKNKVFSPFDFLGEGLWDGITHICDNLFFVSDWATNSISIIDVVRGTKREFVKDISGPADIYFDKSAKILYIPAMGGDKVLSYNIEIK